MHWYVYEVGPIDFNWEHLPTVEETAQKLAGTEAAMIARTGASYIAGVDSAQFMSDWKSAQEAASDAGWAGDFRNPPVVMWVPLGEPSCELGCGFILKQDNNGTTYIVSPVPLPHLGEH